MTLATITLVLLLLVLLGGATVALTTAVVRGDGLIGPGRTPEPPRSHPADTFEQAIWRVR
jgi:hypothetical protein